MITLKHVKINKYKSIETEQDFDVDEKITTLVGKNESGKTAILEALAKSNYFERDTKFTFDTMSDYPRREKRKFDQSKDDVEVISCTYRLSRDLLLKIQEDVGPKTFVATEFTHIRRYRRKSALWSGVSADSKSFLEFKLKQYKLVDKTFAARVNDLLVLDEEELNELYKKELDIQGDQEIANDVILTNEQLTFLIMLKPYYANSWDWENDPISEYITRVWIRPHLPKFLYYDEYYALPSEIEINKLKQEELEQEHLKTSKALFELAGINLDEVMNDENYERYKAELEATGNEITSAFFDYWKTSSNLRLEFDIQKQITKLSDGTLEVNPILKIRVKNEKYSMSLPLASRSKGFNWFFSFVVWFSKIQEDKKSTYILLLDEPGLNLHATAQEDLMRYIEDLSREYQVIYTTHSPFMVDTGKLHRVRTVLETDKGTKVSNSIQEKDPDTLFPLQAALGYDIAQNLFIGKNNLLIEGVSDLVYLTILSGILQKEGRTGLDNDITLVPVGGLDKVTSFISLLRGQKLKIACLLDTFTDQKGKKRLQDLIQEKIIRDKDVRFFNEFAPLAGGEADLEDLFEKDEYLKLFNTAFHEHRDLAIADLDAKYEKIIIQINNALTLKHFNHYRPANELAKIGPDAAYFSTTTLDRFERMFMEINKLF